MTSYTCNCNNGKKFRITYDGGSAGTYHLELCENCYDERPTKFLISEEMIK